MDMSESVVGSAGPATRPNEFPQTTPDRVVGTQEAFGFESAFLSPAFSERSPFVPEPDPAYRFDRATTLAILAGFAHDRRVLVQGWHGTGKSSHVEQIAARLNWPLLRINLDSHIGRIDLLGRDAIVLREGRQVTEFREGLLPWAMRHPCALLFDEYDAGRPDVMFVIQRVLEHGGRLTLLEQNRVIRPNPWFRLFATANTIGLGDATGLYQGTQQLNQGQMDRWDIVAILNYLPLHQEVAIVLARVPQITELGGESIVQSMVELAALTRASFVAGDLSTVMSPRTVINWAANALIVGELDLAFCLTFLNRCDDLERCLVGELYQRCFGIDLRSQETSRDQTEK